MTIDNADITIVFQGGLSLDFDIRYVVDHMRRVFPGAAIFLATQESEIRKLNAVHGFDAVIATADPGALPPVKFEGAPHNVNRQIMSAAAGLAKVETPFAMKIRTDAYLNSRRVVDYWLAWSDAPPGAITRGNYRIVTASFFTVNPRFDERVPYHVGDWFQFGRTSDLVRFWNCPAYDRATGTWYETHPHAPGSLTREREFRSRYSTEQWLTMNYAASAINPPIDYHNHCTPEIIDRFEDALVDNFVVVHPIDIDMMMPKHHWVFKSTYFNALCYSYPDWAELMERKRGQRRNLTGYSQWPRTDAEKSFYMGVRTKRETQWLRRLPGALGRSLDQRFFAWD